MNEKIFINIASFRDPTLPITIKSALVNAKNPENLVFGIGAQYYESEMPAIDADISQIKIINYNPDTRPGLVKIRYEISKLLTDEKYFLMIDSHVIFKKHWDVTAKEQLKRFEEISGHNRVLLTSIESEDNAKEALIPSFKIELWETDYAEDENGTRLYRDEPLLIRKNKSYQIQNDFLLHYYVSCNNFFTYSTYLEDVGLDSKSDFLYEEPYLSWKTYVSGWDVYFIYHNFLRQYSQAYFNIIWGDQYDNRVYYRPELEPSDFDKADIISAMMFNKSKSFAAKNERRSPESFWNFMGEKEMFEELKNSKKFKDALAFFNLP